MRTRFLVPALVVLGGCALRHRPAGPEPARGPATDSLLRFDQARTALGAPAAGHASLLDILDSGVVYLRAGVPAVYGRDAARELLTGPGGSPQPGIAWEPLGGAVSYDLTAGYTFGVAARPSTTGTAIRFERYIAVWRRDRGGAWQIVAYAEVNGPAAVEVSVPTRAFTPPLVALPVALRDATHGVFAADSLFADLSDRMGVGLAFSSTIAPQGIVFVGTSQMVIGPEGAKQYYAAHGEGSSLTWRPVHAWVATSKDLGFTVGEYVATGRGPSGAAVQRFGKYLTVWQRQRDGTWKFVADGGNSTPPKANDK
jgi:ketosteroid isomerase-like protein